jgi:hypothetical protein
MILRAAQALVLFSVVWALVVFALAVAQERR